MSEEVVEGGVIVSDDVGVNNDVDGDVVDLLDVSDRLNYAGSISGPITREPPWAEPVAGARCL